MCARAVVVLMCLAVVKASAAEPPATATKTVFAPELPKDVSARGSSADPDLALHSSSPSATSWLVHRSAGPSSSLTSPSGLLRGMSVDSPGLETTAGFSILKRKGALSLQSDTTLAQSLTSRDTDVELAATAAVHVSTHFSLGVSARAMTEVVNDVLTDDDLGNRFDLVGGPTATYEVGTVHLQLMTGWRSPRGSTSTAGAVVMGGVTIDL